jgi:hypothetical protein
MPFRREGARQERRKRELHGYSWCSRDAVNTAVGGLDTTQPRRGRGPVFIQAPDMSRQLGGLRLPGAKPWIRLLVREGTEHLHPGHVKTGRHIEHDGIADLVSHGDKWAAPGARCRTWLAGPVVGMAGPRISRRARQYSQIDCGLDCVWGRRHVLDSSSQARRSPAVNAARRPPPRGVTLGSIICPSAQGRLIRPRKRWSRRVSQSSRATDGTQLRRVAHSVSIRPWRLMLAAVGSRGAWECGRRRSRRTGLR